MPTKRPGYIQHHHDIKPGKIVDWPEEAASPEEVSKKVSYKGNTQHKTYLSPAGHPALKWDKSKCDKYAPNDWGKLQSLLQEAIRAACTSEFDGDFPSRAWAFINGVLHEARLHNRDLGEYHAFPLNDECQYPTPIERLDQAPDVTIQTIN
jgi:hypothetical protein